MKTSSTSTCVLLLLLATIGCQGPSSDHSHATNTTASEDGAASTAIETTQASDRAQSNSAQDSSPDQDADDIPAEKPDVSEPEEATPLDSTERAILLTPGGPVVVDFIVTVDGFAHQVTLERVINEEMLAADEDRDGRVKWREVANSPRFRYGGIASNPTDVIRLYDADRDGLVGRHELLRYLTNNVGPWDSFTLRSSHQCRDGHASPLRQVLDDDRDGSISRAELEQAAIRLENLDSNDDEIVTLAELQPTVRQPPRPMALRRRADQPEVAWWIQRRTKWDYLEYSLSEMYALGPALTVDDLPLTPDVPVALDSDKDGLVKGEEFQGLAEMPPHVVLEVVFGGAGGSQRNDSTHLKLRSLSTGLKSIGTVVRETTRRVVLAWKDTRVQFFINEDLMLHTPTVSAADLDEDGKLSQYETTRYMSRRLAVYRGLIRGRAAERQDQWFAAIDTNGDARLSFREIRETSDRLGSLDENANGQIEPREIPCFIAIGFVRGNPSQNDDLFAMSPATQPIDPNVPRWFSGMDANKDGEVSRREFPGTPDQFSDLDDNEDGFIGPEET